MRSARSYLFLLITSITAFTACTDNPSDLGLGLVDVKAGEPKSVSLEPAAFEPGDFDISGGYQSFNLNTGQLVYIGATRVMAGKVEDPDLGVIEAAGNVDFIPTSTVTDVFRNGTVSSVKLTLEIDYAYGDTTNTVTLRLAEIMDAWSAGDARSDTVITSGPEILEFSFQPKDESVTIDLPPGWIATNDGRLRSEAFSDDFNGFQLTSVIGNSVVGFGRNSSSLEIAVPGDTLNMRFERMLTSVNRTTPSTPSEYLLLQDGLETLSVEMDFSREGLANSSVHEALFRLDTGSPPLSEPSGFVRPALSLINLVAVTEESGNDRVLLATAEVDEAGRITFSDPDLTIALQNTVRGIGNLVRFELNAPVGITTLDYIFFKKTPGAGGPRLILTITEVN